MDLRQIKYFMWIYEHRSFSAAARKANVAQPALSIQIRHLEEELGVTLFERNSGGVVPTELGRQFYALCTPIRDGVDFARQRISDLAASDDLFGSLKCGFPPSFFKRFLGRVIADFSERHPGVELTVSEGYGGTLKEWVREGALEFAIGGWDDGDTTLQAAQILEEDLVLVSGAPVFGERFSRVDLRAFEGYKLMLPTGQQVLGPMLHQYLAHQIIKPSRTMTVDSYLGVLETARASDWVALIPITGMLDEVAKGDLYIYPLADPPLTFRWCLIHERGRTLSLAARALIDRVGEEMAKTRLAWQELLRNV